MADDVVSLRGEAKLDDIERELAQVQAALDLLRKKADQEILIDAEVQAALEEVERLKRALKQVGEGDEKVRVNADIGPAVENLEKLSTTYRQRLEQMRRQQTPFEALGRDAREETTRAIRRLRELEGEFRAATNRMRRAADDVDFDPASDSARRLQREVAEAARAMIRHLDGLDQEIRQKVTGFNDVAEAAKRASAEVRRFESSSLDNAGRSVDRLTGAFKTLQIAANAFFASIIVDRIARFGLEVTEAAAALRDMERAYTQLFGSQEAGAEQLAHVAEMAKLLGLDLAETREQFLKFVVSARESGFEAETAAALFDSLAIASKGLGNSQAEVTGALKAFSQSISKNKIQAEELRGQLGDRLPAVLGILAKQLGITTSKLEDMLEKGQLMASDALPALANGLLETFGPAAVANIEGAAAEMDRFQTALQQAKEIIGGELSEQVRLFLKDLDLMGESGEENAKKIGDAVGGVAETVRRDLQFIIDFLHGDWSAAWRQAGATILSVFDSLLGAIQGILEGLASVILGSFKSLSQSLVGIVQLAVEGIQSALRKVADLLPDAFGDGVRRAAEALKPLDGIFEQTKENIGRSLDEVNDRFGDSANEFREKLREVADQLEENARASRESTDEQVGHQERLKSKVEELRALFAKLLAERKNGPKEVTDAERKELAKQEKLFADFAAKVRDLLAGVGQIDITTSGGGAVASGAAAGIAAAGAGDQVSQLQAQLQAALQEKERLESQPILSVDDISRIGELTSEINRLEIAISRAGQSIGESLGNFGREEGQGNFGQGMVDGFEEAAGAIEDRGQQMVELLTGLIGSDSFQDAFAGLDSAAQSRLRSLIGQMLEIQDSVGLAEEDIRVFTDAILSELGGRAAGALDSFRDTLDGAMAPGAIDRAWDALNQLSDQAKETGDAAEELGGKLDGAGVSVEETADGWRVVSDNLGDAAEAAGEAGGKVDEASEALDGAAESGNAAAEALKPIADRLMGIGDGAEDAAEGVDSAGEAIEDAGQQMDGAGESAKTLQDLIRQMGEGVEETGIKIEGTGDQIKILKDGVEQTGEASEEAGIRIEGTGDKIEILGQKAEESQEKVKGAGEAAEEAAEPMAQLGEAAKETAEPMTKVAEAAEKIATSEGAPEALRGIGEAATEAAEPVGSVAEAAERLAAALEKIGQAEAAQQLRDLVAVLGEVVEPLGTATDAAQPFADLMTTLEEVVGGVAEKLGLTVEQLARFADLVEQAAALLEEGRLQEGLETLAQAMEEATPSFQAAAEQLQAAAEAISTIAEQVQAASDGLTTLSETATEVVDGGALQSLAETFGELLEKTQPVAEDLVEVATSLERVVEIAEPLVDAATQIGEALGEMASEERVERLREMFEQIQKIRQELESAERVAGDLRDRMAELTEEVDKAKTSWSDFGEALASEVLPQMRQVNSLTAQIARGMGQAADAARDTVSSLLQLESTIEVINAVASAVGQLAGQLQAAAAAAGELKANLAGVEI